MMPACLRSDCVKVGCYCMRYEAKMQNALEEAAKDQIESVLAAAEISRTSGSSGSVRMVVFLAN